MNDQAALAALLRSDLRFFVWKCVQTILPGTPYLPNWHIDAIVHQLMRRLVDEEPGDVAGVHTSRTAGPCAGEQILRPHAALSLVPDLPGTVSRSTVRPWRNWVGGACWWLEPLQARLAKHVFGSGKVFADDTPIPVLDPGRGHTKMGRLWVYTRDDRPWSGTDPPAAVYFYSADRKAERPASHLEQFRGILQVGGYAGFERLTAGGDIAGSMLGTHAQKVLRPA
jgi:hypothetical protein